MAPHSISRQKHLKHNLKIFGQSLRRVFCHFVRGANLAENRLFVLEYDIEQ